MATIESGEHNAALDDAEEFARVLQKNWEGGLLVARSAERRQERVSPLVAENPQQKLSVLAFAEKAKVDRATVTKYLVAWDRAAADGLVPPAEELAPGVRVDVTRLGADQWSSYYHGKTSRGRAETPPTPEGQFACITIDPPWPIKKILREVRPNQSEALDYPTLTVEEIDELVGPVVRAQDNCHVYLWVTQKYLPVGLELFDSWDAKYQCVMTWVKNVGPTPFSWMYDTEHVIFGQRGSVPLEQKGLRLSFQAPTVGHSIKPAVFYERVVAASPGPRLAMFERGEREGFEVWGNEVANVA
jgi:N6-adenosine-specific RNA methylase IME4